MLDEDSQDELFGVRRNTVMASMTRQKLQFNDTTQKMYFEKADWGENYIFYEEHLEDESYDKAMIDEFFVKKKVKFTKSSKRLVDTLITSARGQNRGGMVGAGKMGAGLVDVYDMTNDSGYDDEEQSSGRLDINDNLYTS